jgi:transposase-like protein
MSTLKEKKATEADPSSQDLREAEKRKHREKQKGKKQRNGKGRRKLNKQFTLDLAQAFREEGQHFSAVARKMGCDRRTVKRGWEEGWQALDCLPIRDVIAAEQATARASIQNDWEKKAAAEHWSKAPSGSPQSIEWEKEREQAAKDALASRKEEVQMVRLLRGDTTNALAAVARLLPGIQEWAKQANLMMLKKNPSSPEHALKVIEQASRIVDRVAGAANTVMQMERRLLGQPETIVGVQIPDLTYEEAIVHLEGSERTIRRGIAAGIIDPRLAASLGPVQGRQVSIIDMPQVKLPKVVVNGRDEGELPLYGGELDS